MPAPSRLKKSLCQTWGRGESFGLDLAPDCQFEDHLSLMLDCLELTGVGGRAMVSKEGLRGEGTFWVDIACYIDEGFSDPFFIVGATVAVRP